MDIDLIALIGRARQTALGFDFSKNIHEQFGNPRGICVYQESEVGDDGTAGDVSPEDI